MGLAPFEEGEHPVPAPPPPPAPSLEETPAIEWGGHPREWVVDPAPGRAQGQLRLRATQVALAVEAGGGPRSA